MEENNDDIVWQTEGMWFAAENEEIFRYCELRQLSNEVTRVTETVNTVLRSFYSNSGADWGKWNETRSVLQTWQVSNRIPIVCDHPRHHLRRMTRVKWRDSCQVIRHDIIPDYDCTRSVLVSWSVYVLSTSRCLNRGRAVQLPSTVSTWIWSRFKYSRRGCLGRVTGRKILEPGGLQL